MVTINWLGHDGFQIKGKRKTLYIDPYDIPEGLDAADILFLTHHHFDHCSWVDIEKVRSPATIMITNERTAAQLHAQIKENVRIIRVSDDPLVVEGVKVKAVPAYNMNKHFHPKEEGGLGFLITLDDTLLYHAGDTDRIPEMEGVQCDYAFIPISGTYVMNIEEAVAATERIDAKTFIPMHYGKIVGHAKMGEEFKKRCKKNVEVKEIYQGKRT